MIKTLLFVQRSLQFSTRLMTRKEKTSLFVQRSLQFSTRWMTRKEMWLHTIRRRFFISIWPPWSGPMATTKRAPSHNGIPIRSRVGPRCCDARASNHPNKTTARSPLQKLFTIIFHWFMNESFPFTIWKFKGRDSNFKHKRFFRNLLPLQNTVLSYCRTLHRLHPTSQFENEVFDWKPPVTKLCLCFILKWSSSNVSPFFRTWFY